MPRVTKDSTKKEEKEATSTAKKSTTKTTKKSATKSTKKSTTRTTKKSATKSKSTTTKPKTAKKSTNSSTKKNVTKVDKTVSASPKKVSSTTKKVSSKTSKKSTSTKKNTTRKKASTSKVEKSIPINEYYDLPYRYNQTIVKILAQTPNKLFVYWDISDKDREQMVKNYGTYFFEATKPVLVIHNITLNYTFEVEINDFANSWYLDIEDARCEYSVELGRRPNPYYTVPNNSPVYIPAYVYVSSSNEIEVPNNKVLFNPPIYKKIRFRNVKTGEILERDISEFPFVSNLQKIGEFYNVYDLYKKLYNGEDLDFIHNPSSGLTSSRTYSSQLK